MHHSGTDKVLVHLLGTHRITKEYADSKRWVPEQIWEDCEKKLLYFYQMSDDGKKIAYKYNDSEEFIYI